MLLVTTRSELDTLLGPWRRNEERIVLVPTMGNLHAGHLGLCEQARALGERVVVTIFVNPTQFGPGEDFDSYPRTPEEDLDAMRAAGTVDAVFAPQVDEIYPHGTEQALRLELPSLSRELCGASRPGHFDGVAGVVLRLLNITRPDVLVLGEKDFQQLVLMRWLAADLRLNVAVAGLPIRRTDDGLALSSRNRYLTPAERDVAPGLHRELAAVAAAVAAGAKDFATLETRASLALDALGFDVDYVAIRAADDLALPSDDAQAKDLIVLGAARLGRARLIDNVRI